MNPESEVKQVITDYYNTFSKLDIRAILPFFDQPALIVGPQGTVALPTPEALVPFFGPVMEQLRAQGYGRSDYEWQRLTQLSATAAIATGDAIRRKTDGQEFGRIGITYLLHKTDKGWKFAVMTLHDASAMAAAK